MSELDLEEVPNDPDKVELSFGCLRATQPIGDLFFGVMPHDLLSKITYFDVRRIVQEKRDVETYLGIQRPLVPKKVNALEKFVGFYDASFPSSVILAIDEQYVQYDEKNGKMILRNYAEGETIPSTNIRYIARVLDGQHRIAGLSKFHGESFDVPVTVFVGSDISDQAYIFSTVNLEQNKVSKSLAYDLFALAKTRSPQKTCHNIAVALDRDDGSPFYRRIKRLGVATVGRDFETLTQAQFVEAILKYISRDPKEDRDRLLRGKKMTRATDEEMERLLFRNLFIEEKDLDIADILNSYFSAVKARWPEAWDFRGAGLILNRTNGFRALMRLFREMYLYVASPGDLVPQEAFDELFKRSTLSDKDISKENFEPGSGGESALYKRLKEEIFSE